MLKNSKRYERQGECRRCGLCCLNEECEHLVLKGKIASCSIYDDPGRPEKCKLWPELPPIPFEGCGYSFLDTWENNKVVKRVL